MDVEIEHVVQVQVVAVDEERLLLRAPLHDFSVRLSRDIMTEMLKANAYGQATGAARLALDPEDDRPVLLMTLAVKSLDEASLIGSVIDFMNHAAYWQTVGTDDLEALRENARMPAMALDRWNDVVLVRV
ncbi:type III secretion system chaperone [Aquibium sp. ELW1220]|uniref:type III secretion system chaperone n=1 Tax=Aquibium sp. ELW1220 TaxID=2976766 RepID=UPI0025B0C2EB|nr:type III secretion system chaperone [Aquibium sp. ELW1220]MDN2581429.1 type III secretion system chaperone [Aquibium sp. ELW1220]